jgi:hypothetical protein
MHLRMCTWSSGLAEFLCYLCELFTLFLWTIYAIYVKNRTTIYGLCSTREVGYWTRSLTKARGGG